MPKPILFAFVVASLAACGDDPIHYSAPVGIEVKTKSGDAANNVITEDKSITTESGNPYGKFIADARAKLGGRDPSVIELHQLTLTLGAQSTGVSALEQVMTGDVYVKFLVNETNNTYVAGHFASPTGPGPVDAHETFDWSALGPQDVTRMLGGSFKVTFNAPGATDWATKGAEASLQLTFTFTAYE
jgi:hypothetical protein